MTGKSSIKVLLILTGSLGTPWVQGQDLPIQSFRVMLERHENNVCPLRMDLNAYRVNPSAPPEERAQLRQTGTWIHLNHDHFLTWTDYRTEHSMSDTRLLWFDRGPWGRLHSESQILQLQPPTQPPSPHPASLGLRWHGRRLSRWIRPAWARQHPHPVRVNGHWAWRIEVRPPDTSNHARPIQIWIDRKRKIPLQVATLDSRGMYRQLVSHIEYTSLPDSPWLPWRGRLYQRVRNLNRGAHWHLEADRDSISMAPDSFPGGLFSASFTDFHQPLPSPLPIDDSNNIGPGSIIPEDIWYSTRTPDELAWLEHMRALVLQNEAALQSIHFNWAVRLEGKQPRNKWMPIVPCEARDDGTPYTLWEGSYTRGGAQHVCTQDLYIQSETQWAGAIHSIWDEETLMQKHTPARTPGVIDYATQLDWQQIPPWAWGMRVFGDARPLSALLEVSLARVHAFQESINGWPVTVVDIRHPDNVTDYARLWLDVESGLPLRIDTYRAVHWPQLMRTERFTDVSLLQLPNNAWLPVKAQRIQYRIKPTRHERVCAMAIDIQSILTDPNAINASYFTAPFTPGERIYNAITDRFERYTLDEDHPSERRVKPKRSVVRKPTFDPNSPPSPAEANEVNEVSESPSPIQLTQNPDPNDEMDSPVTPEHDPSIMSPAHTTDSSSAHRFLIWLVIPFVAITGAMIWWRYGQPVRKR